MGPASRRRKKSLKKDPMNERGESINMRRLEEGW